MPPRKLPPNDAVIAMYRSGMSCGQIAAACGVKAVTVLDLLARIGEPRRSNSEAQRLSFANGREPSRYWLGKSQPPEMVEKRVRPIRGERHYAWKGGTSDRREYRGVVVKDACARCGGVDRLAIHHLNNDHYDNAQENLQVLCISCHASVHKQAYWDAIHAGVEPPRSNAPINWQRGGGI